ncbi:hypothetical protein BGZ60DRAFT_430441 [Tricladium varicosporioides]|nr:hypothetical protein BGZ60DRAFT_430441 [Hymenoscyphus varicosporioides]
MLPEPSLGEESLLLNTFFESNMHQPHQLNSPSGPIVVVASKTVVVQVTVQDEAALITAAPELRRRDPEPQQDTCQQADQSASNAIREASQAASQSIAQASRDATDAARQASQSASQAIQQAQNTASQSIAAASRSAAQAMSSASSAVSSIQASAASAVSRANGSMMEAQNSASLAQGSASAAVTQLQAAVAAATGSAAAAGSSFLAAAAKATQGAQASVSAIGAAASSSVSQASAQVSASQNAAVTATQAALAIVGSIIASALITILIYFLIAKHKKTVKRRSRNQKTRSPGFSSDEKFPISDQVGTTVAGSAYQGTKKGPGSNSPVSLSQFPQTPGNITSTSQGSVVKTTSVPWNPSKPPRAPTLGSWLKVQDGVSPFGPINLPTDSKPNSPLGGQLKSPLRSPAPNPAPTTIKSPQNSMYQSTLPLRASNPPPKTLTATVTTIKPVINRQASNAQKPSQQPSQPAPQTLPTQTEIPGYRESKASIWTDEVPDPSPSPPLQSPPPHLKNPGQQQQRSTITKNYMSIPSPKNPVRTTAEWLESIKNAAEPPPSFRTSTRNSAQTQTRNSRPTFGLPRNPRMGSGLPSGPRVNRQVNSVEGEIGFVQGLNRFLPGSRASQLSRMGSDASAGTSSTLVGGGGAREGERRKTGTSVSEAYTPGVGRAM